MADFIINGTLAVLGAVMIYMVIWRVLFFDVNREADPMAIEAFVALCMRGGSLEPHGRLGALQQCFDEAKGNPAALRKSLEGFRRRVERFHAAIEVVANAATEVGLLGTVVSLILGAEKDAATVLIGLGMMSTMYGLIIAIPGKMFHGLTNGRVMRFLDHVDIILEVLDERINLPTSPARVPNLRQGQRMAEHQPVNGHHFRNSHDHAPAPVRSFDPATVRAVETQPCDLNEAEESGIDHLLASDANFSQRVVDWIGPSGDVTNEASN